MAATTIKPYPHVQINVKDNSIATIDFIETLPVHRPLYVMRTKKGPLGEPTWCNTYSEAAALFGAETFDPANKRYFSLPSLYLRDTLTRNGAFITRYLPTQYTEDGKAITKNPGEYAKSVLYASVSKTNIKQYEKDSEGYVKTAWSEKYQEFVKVPKISQGGATYDDPGDAVPDVEDGVQIAFYVKTITSDAEFESIISNPVVSGRGSNTLNFPIAAFKAKDPGEYGNDLAYKLFYTDKNNNAGDVEAYKTVFYNIGFAEREDSNSTWDAIADIYTRESTPFAANPNTINPDTGASMSIDYVLDKGFSDKAHQLPVDFALFEENLNAIGLIIASFEKDVMDAEGNITGDCINVGGAVLGALTTTEKEIVQNYYFNNGSTKVDSELGYMINVISGKNLINQNYDHVLVIKDAEKKPLYDRNGYVIGFEYTNIDTDEKVTLDSLFATEAIYEATTDETPVFGKTYYTKGIDDSYSEFTGTAFEDGVTYYENSGNRRVSKETAIDTLFDTSIENDLVSLTDFFNIALTNGSDGVYYEPVRTGKGMVTPQAIAGSVEVTNDIQSSDDKAMYDFVKLKLPVIKDRIVESLRFPFTHIFDVGYTMKTKKAICDFLDVRDDFVFIASPQVLYSDGSGRSIKQNDMAVDEANTEALRAYSLLMRESVLYGTDCMRVSIYEHSGHLVDSVYQGVVPHTYWAAVQYSQYGNLTYMSATEPRGLPYSYNLLFKDQNWTNYRADSQSRVWDEGGNYVQFADMTRLFYPALRTVYRAATSVLIDEWVVASVVYTKYVARRAWARFSGRNDSATTLQDMIKKYIDTELTLLFNGKYSFNVSVYQTAEERELGYIQHVKISITYGATMRVLDVDIEVNREGFVPEE